MEAEVYKWTNNVDDNDHTNDALVTDAMTIVTIQTTQHQDQMETVMTTTIKV